MKTEILLGDEAAALGALHAGISGSFAYPGTPATELQEYMFMMKRKYPEVYVEWSSNEKTAYEAALGVSYCGKRVIVSMKHVGLNVAADAFINSAITGINGGFVIMVADDPGMHSSQNEQDSRYLAEFAKIPCFEPSNQQEAYDMTLEAFDYSEKIGLPVMVRLVTRLAHSRANIKTQEPIKIKNLQKEQDWRKWILLPGHARIQYKRLLEKQSVLTKYSENSAFQSISEDEKGINTGVIASGIGYNYFMENKDLCDMKVLKVNVYPLSEQLLEDFTKDLDEVYIFEDGYPFIESRLQAFLKRPELKVNGKLNGVLPASGELNPGLVRLAFGKDVKDSGLTVDSSLIQPRPPKLCDGCSHKVVYDIIDELKAEIDNKDLTIFSDIGCYTLGALRPTPSIDTCVCMGASVGMAKGAANSGLKYSVGVIGDSTFFHSGVPTLIKAAGDNTPMTMVILDNSTTGMTGGQEVPIPGTKIDKMVEALGVPEDHIKLLDPKRAKHEDNIKMMRDELEYRGLSVVIARKECVQYVKTIRRKS